MELKEIRAHLDRLDNAILTLLAERLSYSKNVAENKLERGMERYQPEREQEIIDKAKEIAKNNNLNPQLAEDIFKKIIQESNNIQREYLK